MFRDTIDKPIDPIPSDYVNELNRLRFEPDYSLTCLGIALLRPRIKDYKGISGVYKTFNQETSCVTDFIEYVYPNIKDCPTLCYYRYNTQDEDTVRTKLAENGFVVKETIGALLKNKNDTKCLAAYHNEKNCAVIFINSSDIRYYHLIISFISLLFPNLFKEIPLRQPEDYNLIVSLSKTDRNAFVKAVQEMVKPYSVEFKRIMLGSLMKKMHEDNINRALTNVNNQRNNVDYAEEQYTRAIKTLKELVCIYEGMKATESYDNAEEELVEYLSTNKEIHNMSINGSVLTFTIATKLKNFNENAWETFAKRGYIYDGKYKTDKLLDVFKDTENRKLLLDNLFSSSPVFEIKIAGNYSLNFESCHVSTNRAFDYAYADPMYESYVPNPHLKIFECLGGYEQRIIKALRERNYISAIEMCWASAGSVDLDETEQTFRPFLGWILSSREKILVRKEDNVEMTPEEALVYLVDKEK